MQGGTWIQCEYGANGGLESRAGHRVEIDGEQLKISTFEGTVTDGAIRATSKRGYPVGYTGKLRGTLDPSGKKIMGYIDVVDQRGRRKSTTREVFFKNDDQTFCP